MWQWESNRLQHFFSFFIKNNSLLLVKSTAGYSSDRDSLLNEMGACLWSKMSSGRDSLLDETAHHGKDSLPWRDFSSSRGYLPDKEPTADQRQAIFFLIKNEKKSCCHTSEVWRSLSLLTWQWEPLSYKYFLCTTPSQLFFLNT